MATNSLPRRMEEVMKISVSMIVRNERSCIAKALNSVSDAAESDYYSVNYPKLVSVAIKAIQELADKVEKLEKIIAENGITNN